MKATCLNEIRARGLTPGGQTRKEKRKKGKKDKSSLGKVPSLRRTGKVITGQEGTRPGSHPPTRSVSGHGNKRDDKKEKGQSGTRGKDTALTRVAAIAHLARRKDSSQTGEKQVQHQFRDFLSKRSSKISTFFRSFRVIPGSKPMVGHDRGRLCG